MKPERRKSVHHDMRSFHHFRRPIRAVGKTVVSSTYTVNISRRPYQNRSRMLVVDMATLRADTGLTSELDKACSEESPRKVKRSRLLRPPNGRD